MSKDPVLMELKKRKSTALSLKDTAFKNFDAARARTKVARKAMDTVKSKLDACKAELNAEFEAMVYAREHREKLWEEYHYIRDRNNPQIEELCKEANAEHTAMKESYALAKDARVLGNKAESSSHILEGRDHEDRRNALNIEVACLTEIVKNAKDLAMANEQAAKSTNFRLAKSRFDIAKSEYQAACDYFRQCKTERKRLWDKFETARMDYDCAKSDLDSYLAGTPIL